MMKKLIAVLLVGGALFSSNKMYATGNNNIPSANPAKYIQVTFGILPIDSKLYVKDSDGQILYFESVETYGSFRKGFDFYLFEYSWARTEAVWRKSGSNELMLLEV